MKSMKTMKTVTNDLSKVLNKKQAQNISFYSVPLSIGKIVKNHTIN